MPKPTVTKNLLSQLQSLIAQAKKIVVIQAENPDADSLASALALEEILGEAGHEVQLFCSVDMPRYLRYLPGWDRVQKQLPSQFDLSIIVDASAAVLLERTLQNYQTQLTKVPTIIIDHHDSPPDLPFTTLNYIDPTAVSVGEILFELSNQLKWPRTPQAGYFMAVSIISDSGNFVFEKTSSQSLKTVAALMDEGLNLRQLHLDRRQSDIVPARVLTYKAELLKRIEYGAGGAIATITIPWVEIEEYSELYNPSELVIGEMLMVEQVKIATAFKIYDKDGLITIKIRANVPLAAQLGQKFGGGGHAYAAGAKVIGKDIADFKSEFITTAAELITNYQNETL